MIIEERMYTLYVGKVPEFMEAYEREALPILRRHLGHLFGFFINEVGPQNLLVHLWAFEDYADRERRRAALAADPAWPAYRAKAQPKILLQKTRIMRPPPFFEATLKAMLKAGAR